jgi:Kelch motif
MQWIWMGGWNTPGAPGIYGTSSTTAVEEPGGRYAAAAATDAAGNLWLFGGNGNDVAGKSGVLNDAWEYDLSAAKWIWMGGSQSHGQAGTYGTLGMGAAGNIPGARSAAVGWIDAVGNFWLFGGQGLDSAQASGTLNDLWEYQP